MDERGGSAAGRARVDSTQRPRQVNRRRLPSQVIDVTHVVEQRELIQRGKEARIWALLMATIAALMAGGWYLVEGHASSPVWVLSGAAVTFLGFWPLSLRQERLHRGDLNEIWDSSVTNALTGLPNRTVFLTELERALVRSARREESMAVMLIAVDRFDELTELAGRNVSDNVMIELSERLQQNLRLSDVVCHIGTQTFGALLEPTKGGDGARACAERLRKLLRLQVPVAGDTRQSTASIGVVMAAPETAPLDLMERAQEALQTASQMGGNILNVVD